MAISDTLGTDTFAILNRALMQTNPEPESIGLKAGKTFGNTAEAETTFTNPTLDA
tara:strand:- start:24 stop:188 length:165 start_codon:yes stop_codon:yes gene_type:complete